MTIIIQVTKRQMIKHFSTAFPKHDKIKQQTSFNQFDTFQLCRHETNSPGSNKDSLLFSHSRKEQESNKQLGQILSSISKQQLRQSHPQRCSSIKRKVNQTIKDNSQCEFLDPLAQYMASSIDPRNPSNKKTKIGQSRHQIQAFSICQRCKHLDEQHRKQLTFLTKNNQQLYELNKKLSEQLHQFVKNYESLQRQHQQQKKQNSILHKQMQALREKMENMREKYFQRQKKYLKQKEINLKAHEQQLKIMEKINECLQEQQMKSKEKNQNNRPQPKQNEDIKKRAKTQYDAQKSHTKNISPLATWEGSCSKYTPRKGQRNIDTFSEQKIRKEVQSKVDKLSQEKKKILSKVIKQNLTIEDLQTEIPQTALNKMGKGNVGKLTLAKSNLGRSTLYTASISSVPTQKKCR